MRLTKLNSKLVPILLLASLLILPVKGFTQEASTKRDASNPYKIFGVVWRGETDVENGFRDYLRQQDIPYEFTVRNLNLDRKNAPAIVEEIKRVQPDLVYTWGTGTTSSIVGKLQTDTPEQFVRDIPGIFVLVAYPKVASIIESYEQTGRKVTGVAFLATVESQLNAIQAYRPFKKMAVIYDSTSGNSKINVSQLQEFMPKMDMELLVMPIPLKEDGKSNPEALPGMIRQAKADGAELLYMGPDSFITRHGEAYTATAIEVGLPTFASTQAPLKSHRAMFGLVTDYYTLGKLAGVQAEEILVKGKPPQDVPVRRLSRFKLWINTDVVQEIGTYPPMSMITIADFQTSKNAN